MFISYQAIWDYSRILSSTLLPVSHTFPPPAANSRSTVVSKTKAEEKCQNLSETSSEKWLPGCKGGLWGLLCAGSQCVLMSTSHPLKPIREHWRSAPGCSTFILQYIDNQSSQKCSDTPVNSLLKYQTSNYVNNSFIVEWFMVFCFAKWLCIVHTETLIKWNMQLTRKFPTSNHQGSISQQAFTAYGLCAQACLGILDHQRKSQNMFLLSSSSEYPRSRHICKETNTFQGRGKTLMPGIELKRSVNVGEMNK